MEQERLFEIPEPPTADRSDYAWFAEMRREYVDLVEVRIPRALAEIERAERYIDYHETLLAGERAAAQRWEIPLAKVRQREAKREKWKRRAEDARVALKDSRYERDQIGVAILRRSRGDV